jgi:hypothetical protein
MQSIEATFEGISLHCGRGSLKVPPQFRFGAIGAAVAVSLGCLAAAHLHRSTALPTALAPLAAPQANAPVNFGAMIVEPEWAAEASSPNLDEPRVASLESAWAGNIPLPSLDVFPPSAEAVTPPLAAAQPPTSDVAKLEEGAPLPPPRPPGFGEAPRLAPPRVAEPSAPTAPVDNRNFFQKLLGLGMPSAPGTQTAPGTQSASLPESRAAVRPLAPPPPPPVASAPAAAPTGRGWSGLFGFGAPSAPQGYDRQTAVYDISAHTVYMPDGSRLEAHSGLGDRLDDPRHVDERARGATPPHLYELTLREGSFHGVQAIRLNPVGEGGIYGRAGLLAHPYMLGPNGDSNGCVSVRDYEAFLRAFENGQVRRLMVVANASQVMASNETRSLQR